MTEYFKLLEEFKFRIYYNPVIGEYLKSLPEHDAMVAADALMFIKQTYPEVRRILNGDLVSEGKEE